MASRSNAISLSEVRAVGKARWWGPWSEENRSVCANAAVRLANVDFGSRAFLNEVLG